MHLVDINGDGLKDLVTGKRWWAHGKGDAKPDDPAVLYWFEAKKSKDGIVTFTPLHDRRRFRHRHAVLSRRLQRRQEAGHRHLEQKGRLHSPASAEVKYEFTTEPRRKTKEHKSEKIHFLSSFSVSSVPPW